MFARCSGVSNPQKLESLSIIYIYIYNIYICIYDYICRILYLRARETERERDRCTFEPTTITRPTTICWLKQVRNQLLLLRLSMKIAPKTRVDTPYPVNSRGFSHENPLPPQLPYFSNELLLKDACLLLHNPTCSVVHVFSMENMPSKWSWWLLG